MQFWVNSFTLSNDDILDSLYIGNEMDLIRLRILISLVEITLSFQISKANQIPSPMFLDARFPPITNDKHGLIKRHQYYQFARPRGRHMKSQAKPLPWN